MNKLNKLWLLGGIAVLSLALTAQMTGHAGDLSPLSEKKRSEYRELSPFEFKNILGEKASKTGKSVLNAGRGNPNFINTRARLAFSMLHRFAVESSIQYDAPENLGFPPTTKTGMADRFFVFLNKQPDRDTVNFILACLKYCDETLDISPDVFVADLVDAILGDHYPTPSRMLETPEKIVLEYLKSIHFPKGEAPEKFNVFATEGATAAMIYVFNSLKENFLVNPGEKIAIITPIFSPYLEIPVLKDYDLVPVYMSGSEYTDWALKDDELNKLKDKSIKALFMVNPMNPGAVSMNLESVRKIAGIVKSDRPDLIVLTDTVYCPFVNEFHDLLQEIPGNCIGAFSYSKYFGVTGWRLGAVFMRPDNVCDRLISELPDDKKALLAKRYESVSTEPEKIPFIERLLMDSRQVALAHTGGLSTPQQCVMTLFSLHDLLDENNAYKKSIQMLLNRRMKNLYSKLKAEPPKGESQTQYYNLVDIIDLAERLHGAEFAGYLKETYSPFGFLLELAERHQTILLPGVGFAGPEWSARVSLANLPDEAYTQIGQNLVTLLEAYFQHYQNK